MANQYDVIMIGSGAGGGTLARHLAPSGKKILLLERGDWLNREPENWSAEEVFVHNRYVSPDIWHDKNGKAFQPGVHYFVGGATKMYGAALYRLRKEDFSERQHYEQELLESEARYRTLFESIDAGFCVIEVLFEGDEAIDYRFLETNPAFTEQTGLEDAIGGNQGGAQS